MRGISRFLLEPTSAQVIPLRILLDDQSNLFCPAPAFDLLLSSDRVPDVVKYLGMDQSIHPVTTGKTGQRLVPMLPNTSEEVVSHADIKDSANGVGKNINVIAAS